MTVEIGIIISLIGCMIAVVGFIAGQKKSGRDDGMELGAFIGEMRTEIASIKVMINELKSDHKEVDDKIDKAINDHEKRFHKN